MLELMEKPQLPPLLYPLTLTDAPNATKLKLPEPVNEKFPAVSNEPAT